MAEKQWETKGGTRNESIWLGAAAAIYTLHVRDLATYVVTVIVSNSNLYAPAFSFFPALALIMVLRMVYSPFLRQPLQTDQAKVSGNQSLHQERSKGGSNHEQDINKSNLLDRRRFVTVTISQREDRSRSVEEMPQFRQPLPRGPHANCVIFAQIQKPVGVSRGLSTRVSYAFA